MKVICDYKDCTGCGLCAARCPKHCIEMKPGFLGHLYPVIDQENVSIVSYAKGVSFFAIY